ncbi:MAG: hypothetical protein IPO78_13695 [Saprospiraceae bacterium]|nr:hypothetical protein [Saprospiraceae bacterium]
MKYIPIILIILLGCADKVKLNCPPNYNFILVDEINKINNLKSKPNQSIRKEIINHITNCPRLMHDLLDGIDYNHKVFYNTSNNEYYLNLEYDLIADSFLSTSQILKNINTPEIYTAYKIKSLKLRSLYYKFLVDKTPLWRNNRLPVGYFYGSIEMPPPIRVCDLALDGLIYLGHKSKVEYYQQFFNKDSFDLSIYPPTAGNYQNLYKNVESLNEVRDSLIDSMIEQK